MISLSLVLAVGPGAALACSPTARPDPRVPTWRAAMGFALGAREATGGEIDRYMALVDRASARVRVLSVGASAGGRPIRVAVAGDPAHVAPGALARLATRMRAARAGRLSAAGLRRLAAGPLFAWIAGTVHGNEPSGGDADMALLYRLAAGRTCADVALRHRLVTFVLPVQNPDGRAAGTHVDAARFDLNRDWFAATQPETRDKLAALERYPPVVFADQHEEGGTGFFFPPNADPIHHEISAQALHAIDGVIAPRLRAAFRARHVAFVNYDTYDLFFMGYGDTVPSTLFGAAGMTFEKGGAAAYPVKVAQHLLAAGSALGAAADHRGVLLRAWAAQWRQAAAQGARGVLQPNRVVQPGDTVRFAVPSTRVYGYAIRSDRHGADAEALARRLAAAGVRVERLIRALPVPAFHAYGGATAAATLPAGTLVISMAQPAKHWVEAMLGADPYVPFPYFYDVSSWSNPLLMGLGGGALEAPVAIPPGAAVPVGATAAPAEPSAGAPAYAWDGDSERSAELALTLLAGGAGVARGADGSFAAALDAPDLRTAAAAGVTVTALGAPPADAVALRRPRVALFGDTGQDDGPGDLSAGWARWLLDRRYHLGAAPIGTGDIADGALDRFDVLVVPDGSATDDGLDTGALARLQAWVRAGGTLVAWRDRGLAIARAAGLTSVRPAAPPAGFLMPGAELRVTLDPADPVAAGEQPEGFVFNTGDPILEPGGAHVVAAYPADARFFVSGYTSGADVLRGTAAATDEVAGRGRVVLFAFDPVFRGYTDGTERLLGNALLAPTTPASARRAGASPVDPAALLAAAAQEREVSVQVAAEDEAGLLRAARAAGVPEGFTLDRDLTTVTLRAPSTGEAAIDGIGWAARLPSALAAAGVRPLLAVL